MISAEFINENIDIKDLAEKLGITLRQKGRGVYGLLCPNPMHNDTRLGNCNIVKRNSRNYFHCFACGAGGGPIDLVMYHMDCDFVTAIKMIANWYGLEEDDFDFKPAGLTGEEYRLLGLSSVILDEYDECFTLRNFALESPEAHDQLVSARIRRTTNNLLSLLKLILTDQIPGIEPDPEWISVIFDQIYRIEELATKSKSNSNIKYQKKRSA